MRLESNYATLDVMPHDVERRAWPRSVVEDSNLKVQLSTLRRALNEGQRGQGDHATEYVATVTGRGYLPVFATHAYAHDKLEAGGDAPEMRRRLARLQGPPKLSEPVSMPGRAPRPGIALRASDSFHLPGTTS